MSWPKDRSKRWDVLAVLGLGVLVWAFLGLDGVGFFVLAVALFWAVPWKDLLKGLLEQWKDLLTICCFAGLVWLLTVLFGWKGFVLPILSVFYLTVVMLLLMDERIGGKAAVFLLGGLPGLWAWIIWGL